MFAKVNTERYGLQFIPLFSLSLLKKWKGEAIFHLEKNSRKFRSELFPQPYPTEIAFPLRHSVSSTLVWQLSPWVMQNVRDIHKYLKGWSFTHFLWFLLDQLDIRAWTFRSLLWLWKNYTERKLLRKNTLLLPCLATCSFPKFQYYSFLCLFFLSYVSSLTDFLHCWSLHSDLLKALSRVFWNRSTSVLLFHDQMI